MSEKKVKITFVYPDKVTRVDCFAEVGQTVLQVAHKNAVPIEGSCEGALACSTCHVIVDPSQFSQKIAEKSIAEEDTLDFVQNVQPTSRLCCQIVLDESMDGLVLFLPEKKKTGCCGGGCCKG